MCGLEARTTTMESRTATISVPGPNTFGEGFDFVEFGHGDIAGNVVSSAP